MNNLFITDGQNGNVLDHINKQYVLSNEHEQDLPTNLETFNFTTIGDIRFAEHLGKRNGLIVPGEDGELIEFRIFEALKYRDDQGLKVEVYSKATYLDIKKSKVFDPHKTAAETAQRHTEIALAGTGIQVGNIAFKGVRTLEFDSPFNPYDYIKRIAREFELEIKFYVTHDGSKITGRYLDLVDQIGEWRGRTVEFGRDLKRIERIESTDDIVTALWVYGPERENGTRLKVFVEDEEARQRWGPNGKHLVDYYEPQTINEDITEERLTTLGNMELKKRINAVVSYLADVVDLENVPGMENKKIRFGDTIRTKDLKFSPPLYLEARIFNQKRDVFNKANKRVELGDYREYTEDEVKVIWKQLRDQISKKISIAEMLEYAEPKKILSDTPPAQTENVTWIDTSQDPYVPKVYNFDEWQKMSPTTASEVDAYTRLQTDEITRDASRLETGIIDVGSVPLRTSVTGARIEWDGVNGLVQYNTSGKAVSWLDLEGNAHFEDGYFEGEIVANSGTFRGDVIGAKITGSSFYTAEPGLNAWLDISAGLIAGEADAYAGAGQYHTYQLAVSGRRVSMINQNTAQAAVLEPGMLSIMENVTGGRYIFMTPNQITADSKLVLERSGAAFELHALTAGASGYIDFTDPTGRRGYFGYPSASHNRLTILNQTGDDVVITAGSARVQFTSQLDMTRGFQMRTSTSEAPRWEFNRLANGLEILPRGSGFGNIGTLFLGQSSTMVQIEGNFLVKGSKSAVARTESYGDRLMYALESTGNYFSTLIHKVLEEGEHTIEVEPMFLETIRGFFIKTFLQNDGKVTILGKTANTFTVSVTGKANVLFEVIGERRGYEGVYMEEVLVDKPEEEIINETIAI